MIASAVHSNLKIYLEKNVSDGKRYFRSKTVSETLGMSPHEFGQHMRKLARDSDQYDITVWSKKSHTWLVRPRKGP